MEIARGQTQDGIVIGNTFDKYGSQNPLVRILMNRFDSDLHRLVEKAQPTTIHEVGCGEGYWVLKWRRLGIDARGTDFSSHVIEMARLNARSAGLPESLFQMRSIYDVRADLDRADLIVCCEVLEHLKEPQRALDTLTKIVAKHLILSVPREPIWRLLNLIRAKYVGDLGNTPGHLQHWSRRSFVALVSNYFKIVEVRHPLPWTMLLCRPM